MTDRDNYDAALVARAALHAALGEPARLAIVEELATSDRSPLELGAMLSLPSNRLAHHLDVLESLGVVERTSSAGDGRRKYVRLVHDSLPRSLIRSRPPRGEMLFLCTRNSARSQLAAALWTSRTGLAAGSAGTHPARVVDRAAVAAARRARLSLTASRPTPLDGIPEGAQVVTVCDLVHEELDPSPSWWHWSIPDPVGSGPAAFDAVVAALDSRIRMVVDGIEEQQGTRTK